MGRRCTSNDKNMPFDSIRSKQELAGRAARKRDPEQRLADGRFNRNPWATTAEGGSGIARGNAVRTSGLRTRAEDDRHRVWLGADGFSALAATTHTSSIRTSRNQITFLRPFSLRLLQPVPSPSHKVSREAEEHYAHSPASNGRIPVEPPTSREVLEQLRQKVAKLKFKVGTATSGSC